MLSVPALVMLVAFLGAGSAGWGNLALTLARRSGWEPPAPGVGWPLRTAIGVSTYLAVGGLLVACNLAWFWTLVLWHALGCALLLHHAVRSRRALLPSTRSICTAIALATAGTFGLLVAIGNSLDGLYNFIDDTPAYLYLDQRLLLTGGLIDPFNFRRVASYGGSQLYQALFLRISGVSSVQAFEFVFGLILVASLVIGTTRRHWLIVGTVLLGFSLLAVHTWLISINTYLAPLPITNTSPEFSACALTLATLQLGALVRRAPEHGQRPLYILIGLCAAGLLALRFTFLPGPAVAVGVVLLSIRDREKLIALGVTLATLVGATLGWALASFRSSDTFFLPLLPGNYDPKYLPARDPYYRTVATYMNRFWATFRFDNLGWVAVVSAVIGLALIIRPGARRVPGIVLLSMALGCLVQLVLLTIQFTGSAISDIGRFEAPSTLACALFAAGVLWPHRPRTKVETGDADCKPFADVPTPTRPSYVRPRRLGRARVVLGVIATAAAGALLWSVTFGDNVSYKFHLINIEMDRGARVIAGPGKVASPYSASDLAAYGALNALIPRGAKVLAAVDDPALLDMTKFTVATVDQPDAASPPPHIHIFRGAGPLVRYLRRLGYTYLAVDSPQRPGIYNLAQWQVAETSTLWTRREYGRYYVQWQRDVDSLEASRRFPVFHTRWLTLIDLRPHRSPSHQTG